ncbi:unnamed protein product [Hapterophycus canaliculatus]
MTAGKLLQPAENEHNELQVQPNRPWSPPVKPNGPEAVVESCRPSSSKTSEWPRTSSPSPSHSIVHASKSAILPPQLPYNNNYINNDVDLAASELGATRPRDETPAQPRNRTSSAAARYPFRTTQPNSLRSSNGNHGSSSSSGSTDTNIQLSKSAKLLEEDRQKVASIRSFLLNFLEERDCSIKKRLDLYVHQTETGRPVTDAVVQEVCKLRPDMIGLSLRDCTEVTDVGLWCIARHTTALRELNISGCQSVTNIGLRSLAICCDKMEQLDFTSCTRLTDLGLRVLGGGCWSLKSLTLEGCAHVSDTGVAELAKMSTGLTYLNISRCERVGEYGDRALIQLGRSCHQLKGLDAFGCSHAQDPGLLSVARGCPKLEKLMLTGCGGITGKSVRALARGCSTLRDLSLSGCGGVGNGDLRELAKGCTSLRHLNIAECAQVDAQGLAALAGGLKNLTELDVGGCQRVDDSALRALCSMNAQFLNLSGCAAITETGVAGIAMNCTALSSLNVTGCPGIGRRFMAELCHSMKFSEPAQAYFGFQPRKNAKELLAKKEAMNRRMVAAIVVQANMRGRLARGRANIVRRNWVIKTRLAKAQAIIRGYFARKWYRAWRAQVREHRAAASIQATWRMLGDRRTAERLRKEKVFREMGQSLATRIQAGWWGHRGRVRMQEIRAIRARRLLLEARLQARKERAAIMIQSNLRRFFAQTELAGLRRLRDESLAREKREKSATVLIQSVARMREGRAVLTLLKARRDLKILEWEMALKVQAAWRGRMAKMVAFSMRILQASTARQRAAAITIQSFWRAVRARHLTTIQRAMFKIRQIQEIQRVYRGFKGRLRAKARKSVFEADLGREAAAMAIEKIFRGHKGRERFECKQHLRSLEDEARPLLLKLDELTEKAVQLSDRMRYLAKSAEPLRAEHRTIREELFHIRHTTDKYTDSDKARRDTRNLINGCRQRFLTKFLKVRLVEVKRTVEERLEKLEAEAIEVEVKERRNTRILRQTERELIPLGKGTVEKVKLLRTARLRKKVRSQRSGARTIQRTFRGWRVRRAINSWYRDYWIESEDAATGDVYYVNTWNQEIRWVKPLEISLFEDRSSGSGANRPGTGDSSKLSFLDDDDDGDDLGGADTISGRFRQRLFDLTKEAALAAEEEESFLRYVAANAATLAGKTGDNSLVVEDGADSDARRRRNALAAAREWRFVRTDASFDASPFGTGVKKKCWYHSMTSEYFWGDHPPLLGLLRLHIGDDLRRLEGKTIAGSGSGRSSGGRKSGGDNDGAGNTLAISGDCGRGIEPAATVHLEFGLVFADRASGEAWLKAQELDLLLKGSEKVCDIGLAGWCQLRAAVPSTVPVAGGIDEKRAAPPNSTALAEKATDDFQDGQGTGPSVGVLRVDKAGAATAAAVADDDRVVPRRGSSMPCPFFTFFHRAETGEVRWCLSPRSALIATPRTARREVSQARLISRDQNYEDQQMWTGQSVAGEDHDSAHTTAATDSEPLAFTSNDKSAFAGDVDGWELVEDGDMVFYYNQKLGISTWEPPPGWDLGGGQEINGAGG